MLVVTTRAVLVALIAMGMLAGCGRAVSKPEEPEPTPMEPPGPTAAELIAAPQASPSAALTIQAESLLSSFSNRGSVTSTPRRVGDGSE